MMLCLYLCSWEMRFHVDINSLKISPSATLNQSDDRRSDFMFMYMACQLTSAEHDYMMNDEELYVISIALRRFCFYLQGSKIIITTDN